MTSTLFKQFSKPWTPRRYQKKAVKFLLEHAAAALFLDPGLGKTAVTLGALKILKECGLIDRVLIVAPLRVCHSVWPGEINKWTDFAGLSYAVLHGPAKDDLLLHSDADIFLVNFEGLEWLLNVEKRRTKSGKIQVRVDIERWRKLGFDTLVVDELTAFKNTNSIRFKAIKQVIGTFRRRWGLTGTPAANGLMGLFGQCYVLDEGRTFGRYITHFRREYFDRGYSDYDWLLKPGAEERIYERLKPLALRMGDDLIDMPKLVENNILIELPQKAMSVYTTLEDKLLVELENGKVTAGTAASASIKCRQIANGGVYLDDEVEALLKLPGKSREWAKMHDAKVDALAGLIEELQGSPVLVAYEFQHDLERIKAKLGKSTPHLGRSGVKARETAKLIARWNNGDIPVLLVHPAAAAHGLDGLQHRGNHVVWFSMTWDYELYDQLIRRVRRSGSKATRVYVHHLMAKDTIDEAIFHALKSKARGQRALFNALKNYAGAK